MRNPIEKAFNEYENKVFQYAKEQFEKVIKPYCQKHELQFLAGNGTYYLGANKHRQNNGYLGLDIDKLPKKIRETLQMEIPGMPGNDLGTLMPDYDPDEDK